jgi:hypothetical protein
MDDISLVEAKPGPPRPKSPLLRTDATVSPSVFGEEDVVDNENKLTGEAQVQPFAEKCLYVVTGPTKVEARCLLELRKNI